MEKHLAPDASVAAAFVAAHGGYLLLHLFEQPCSLADAYNSAADGEKSNVIDSALDQGLERQLRDIPRMLQTMKALYAFMKQPLGSTSKPTMQECFNVLEILFLAGPGRAACTFMKRNSSASISAKLDDAHKTLCHPALPAELKKLTLLAIVGLSRLEPATLQENVEVSSKDQSRDSPGSAWKLMGSLWEALLGGQETAKQQMRAIFVEVDKMLASEIAPYLRIMIFSLASLLRPDRYYAVGSSIILLELKTAQQAQWDSDGVFGQEPRSSNAASTAPPNGFPNIDAELDSGLIFTSLNGSMHEFDAEEAKAYAERPSRSPDRTYDEVDHILDNKLLAQRQVFAAIATFPVTADDDDEENEDEKLKKRMIADFGAFLNKHFGTDDERRRIISALAVNVVEALCEYYLNGMNLYVTIQPKPEDKKLGPKQCLQAILDALLLNKWACINLLKSGQQAIKNLIAIPNTIGRSNFKWKRSNGIKQTRINTLEEKAKSGQAGSASSAASNVSSVNTPQQSADSDAGQVSEAGDGTSNTQGMTFAQPSDVGQALSQITSAEQSQFVVDTANNAARPKASRKKRHRASVENSGVSGPSTPQSQPREGPSATTDGNAEVDSTLATSVPHASDHREQHISRKSKRFRQTAENSYETDEAEPQHKKQRVPGNHISDIFAGAEPVGFVPHQAGTRVSEGVDGENVPNEDLSGSAPPMSHALSGSSFDGHMPNSAHLQGEATGAREEHEHNSTVEDGRGFFPPLPDAAQQPVVLNDNLASATGTSDDASSMDAFFVAIGAVKGDDGLWYVRGVDGVWRVWGEEHEDV